MPSLRLLKPPTIQGPRRPSAANLGREPDLVERFGYRGRRSGRSHRKGSAAEVEEHWQSHMSTVSKVMLGQNAETVIDLLHHET